MYGTVPLGKTVACSFYDKNLKHFEKRLLQKILFFRSSCSEKENDYREVWNDRKLLFWFAKDLHWAEIK